MLAEYWRGEITLRQLRVLVEHLPPDCALGRAQTGHTWREQEFLLACVVDAIQFQTAQLARAQGVKVKKPKPLKRPPEQREQADEDDAERRPTACEAHQALRDRLAARRG